MFYSSTAPPHGATGAGSAAQDPRFKDSLSDRIFTFPTRPLSLAFDDSVLDEVKAVWDVLTAGQVERGEFLRFGDDETEDDHTPATASTEGEEVGG